MIHDLIVFAQENPDLVNKAIVYGIISGSASWGWQKVLGGAEIFFKKSLGFKDEKSSKSLAEDESSLFICFPPCFPFVYFGSQATAQSLFLRLLLLESEVARRQRAGTLISMKRMKMTMDTDDQRPRRKRRMLKWKRAKQLHWRAKLQPQRKRRLLKRPRSASLPGRSIRIVRWWKTKI